MSLTSVQLVPFQDSVMPVRADASIPPKFKAAVCVPHPAADPLAVFKLLTSVQLVPFQVSVCADLGPAGSSIPPKTKPAVVVPAPLAAYLLVFKVLTAVQLVPLYTSALFKEVGEAVAS